MSRDHEQSFARWINLLVPGGGLIAIGEVWTGVVVALFFAVSANAAIAARLLLPDEFSPWLAGLCIGVAAGTYIGAQFRLAHTVRERRRAAEQEQRRAALTAVCDRLERGDGDGALEALEPLRSAGGQDLLVAFRLAQVLTLKRDVSPALEAWQQVRILDRHHVYRRQIANGECVLRGAASASEERVARDPNGA